MGGAGDAEGDGEKGFVVGGLRVSLDPGKFGMAVGAPARRRIGVVMLGSLVEVDALAVEG